MASASDFQQQQRDDGKDAGLEPVNIGDSDWGSELTKRTLLFTNAHDADQGRAKTMVRAIMKDKTAVVDATVLNESKRIIKIQFKDEATAARWGTPEVQARAAKHGIHIAPPPPTTRKPAHITVTGFDSETTTATMLADCINKGAGKAVVDSISIMQGNNSRGTGQCWITLTDPDCDEIDDLKCTIPVLNGKPLTILDIEGVANRSQHSEAKKKQPKFYFRLSSVPPTFVKRSFRAAILGQTLPHLNQMHRSVGHTTLICADDIQIEAWEAREDMGDNCWRFRTNSRYLIKYLLDADKKNQPLLMDGHPVKIHLDHQSYHALTAKYKGMSSKEMLNEL